MKGTRPLTNTEIREVSATFSGRYGVRNKSFFMLGVSIGGRVSELLALHVEDVYQNGRAVTDFQFDKEMVKGKETARTIPVNTDGQKAIQELMDWHKSYFGKITDDRPLFPSVKGGRLKRQAVHKILKTAFEAAGLNGKLATHTLRKSFAQRVYDNCNDIFIVKELLGHKNVATTQAYIGINYVTARAAVEAMSLDAEENPKDPLAAFETSDLIETLLKRGYEISKRQDIGSSPDSVPVQEVVVLKESA